MNRNPSHSIQMTMPDAPHSPHSLALLTLGFAFAFLPGCSRQNQPPESRRTPATAALADAPPPSTPFAASADTTRPPATSIEDGVHLILATEKPEPTTTFELRFDAPVVSPERVGDASSDTPLRIDPPLKGSWTWLSTRSGVFVPDEPLRMAQRYALSLAPLTNAEGKPVAARLNRSIETPGLELLTSPPQPETNATARPSFVVHFNANVDPSAVAPFAAFSDAGGRTIPAKIERLTSYYSLDGYFANSPEIAPWHLRFPGATATATNATGGEPGGRISIPNAIVAKSPSPLPPGKGWRLILAKGLPADGVAATLARDIAFPIGDVQPLRVVSAEPSNVVGARRGIRLRFNKAIGYADTNALAKAISIQPPPGNLSMSSDYWTIGINGAFSLDTEYAVTTDTSLHADDGTPLESRHVARIRFSPVPPRLYFPDVHSWQQARGKRSFDFLAVNVSGVRARASLVAPSAAPAAFALFAKAYLRPSEERGEDDLEPYRRANLSGGPFAAMRNSGAIKTVWEKTLDATAPVDETKRIALNWDEILGKGNPGVVLLELETDIAGKRIGAQTLVQISDIGAVLKRAGGDWHAWVFSNQTGEPIPASRVAADGKTATTAKDGTARLPAANPQDTVSISAGADATVFEAWRGQGDLPPWGFDIPVDYGASERTETPLRIFVFGDRLVYQPGETVHLKVIARALDEKGLSAPPTRKAHVRILDGHGRAFFDEDAQLGPAGSTSVSVPIPTDILGACNAQIEIGESSEWHYFHVAHYEPDAFDVKISGAKDFGPTETITLPLACQYYFGKPLSGAHLKWNVNGSDTSFSPEGFAEFSFLDSACAYSLQPERQSASEEGELTLGPDGAAQLGIAAPLNGNRPVPRDFRALVEVTDINQQTVSDAVTFTRHSSEYYLGLRDPEQAARAGAPIAVDMIAVNADGTPTPKPVTAIARFSRIDWVTRNVEGAGHARVYEKEARIVKLAESEVTSGKVRHSGDSWRWVPGSGSKTSFTADAPGSYLLEVTTSDPAGRPVRTARTFNVFGEGEADWDYRDTARIELEPDRDEYRPGDTATILVKTPIAGTALVSVEREKVMRSFVAQISRSQSSLRIPLLPGDAPNVFVSVILIRGALQSPREAPAPEHRFGYCQLKIGDPKTRLRVAVKPGAVTYVPGNEVTLTTTVSDASDAAIKGAEVTLYAVDEGVLALMGYQTPDPHAFFYAPRPLGVESWLTLPSLLPEDPAKRSYTNKGFIVGDGGDFDETLRRKMLACAFWNATLQTDAHGRVTARFQAPDSLTRYRVIAVASADSGRFGSAESAFRIRKPLMLQPSTPAFARIGDRLTVRAVVQNETGAAGRFDVSLETDARASADGSPDSLRRIVSIAAGGTAAIDFPVRFSAEGTSRWIWRAKALDVAGTTPAPKAPMPQQSTKGARANTSPTPPPKPKPPADSVESNIQVSQPADPVRLVQSLRLTGGAANVLAGTDPMALEGHGTIRVTIANTPLAELADATDSLLHYPYGCVEQTASSLLPLVVLLDSADMVPGLKGRQAELGRMARAGITRLLNMQTPSGGLSYWPGTSDANPWASAYGAAILAIAKRSGQQVPSEAMGRLHEYLRSQMANTANLRGDASLGPRCLAAWALAIGGAGDASYHQILFEKRADLSPENRALLAMAILDANGPEDMARELAASATTGERLASLWFDDPARDVALRLLASTMANASATTTAPLVDRLLDLRRNGDWRTTQGNAWAVYALAEFTRLSGQGTSASSGGLARAGTPVLNFHLPASGGFAESSLDLPWSGPAELTLAAKDHATIYARTIVESRPDKPAPARQDRGFSVAREYRKVLDDGTLAPATDLRLGDRVLITLTIQSPRAAAFVAIEDPLPCVLEAVNPDFKTREAAGADQAQGNFWPDYRELRGDKIVWFRDRLAPGTWRISYLARTRSVGTAVAPSARITEMYRPERLGTTDVQRISVSGNP